MATVAVEQLFDLQRLPENNFLSWLFLLLYTPFGVCLLLLRLFIGVHVFLISCALPDSLIRRFIVRVMCSVLGLLVKQNDPRLIDRTVKVYICNHVTPFDHNVINLLTSCNTPMLGGLPSFVCWARGFMEMGGVIRRSELTETLNQYVSQEGTVPLLLFPEEETTNGRTGLLKFCSWPFTVADVIQPVALFVKRPFLSESVADSSWIAELLWIFFMPFTVYQVRWLQSVSKNAGESFDQFAERVQKMLQWFAGVKISYKNVLLALFFFLVVSEQSSGTRPQTSFGFDSSSSSKENTRIGKMAEQVKEVLPHVPLSVIKAELVKTDCIDATITNLLEGQTFAQEEEVSFGASAVPSTSASWTSTTTVSRPSDAVPSSKVMICIVLHSIMQP
ncbi:lipid droplet-regulating VLDL assembly factor AUP1 [Protopterus annectens]|uniref:lipid droplet-regulating VLDL assembly factor AUP1 n=1 Tax=Protopterus annectens TaxID=7888 RepID=UPI001CF9F88E|nr:lipid droplet-regulating VLDL assembly factor AUP1 [Protopterus annectens]